MKLYDWIIDYCDQRGMFPDDAKAVAKALLKNNEEMEKIKDKPIEDYPITIHATLALEINQTALSYIEKNCPNAWFRTMFV